MAPLVRRTWAPQGRTPVIRQRTRSHRKVSVIGGVAVTSNYRRTRLMFRLHPNRNVDASLCVAFLQQLLANIRGKVFVVWDRFQAHRSRKVARFVERHRRLSTFLLPAYAPELNPIEMVWGHAKTVDLANFVATDEENLARATKKALCRIRKQRRMLKNLVGHCLLRARR